MSTISNVHSVLAWVVIAVNAIAGTWSTAAHWYEPLRARARIALVVGSQVVVVAQVALGSILVGFGGIDGDPNHMFYGFLTFASVGFIIAYRSISQYRFLLEGLGALFIMGLAIRTMFLSGAATVAMSIL